MPDGDVGSATPSTGNGEPTKPEPHAPKFGARVSKLRGHFTTGGFSEESDEEPTNAGTPAAEADAAAPTSSEAAGAPEVSAEAKPAKPAARRRASMSARLGTVPDAPPNSEPPAAVVVRPANQSTSPDTEPLVPEVMPAAAAPATGRAAPAPSAPPMPKVVPATQPEVTAPPIAPTAEPAPAQAPYDLDRDELLVPPPVTRVRRRRPRVRRVTRVVRSVDTWSVFKVALIFAAVLYGSGLLSGVLLWNVAHATGTIDNAERFMESFGWETFEFHGDEIFHDAWIIGLFLAAGLVGLAVLAAATFNLVSDLVGGVRVTVLEEEMVVRPVSRRRKRIRKAPIRKPPPAPEPAPVDEPMSTSPVPYVAPTAPVPQRTASVSKRG